MKVLEFPGYGVNAADKYIAASRVVSFELISHNGRHGTEINMDDGSSVRVRAWPEDVKRALESVGVD